MHNELKANATTVQIDPGSETQDGGGVHVRHRVFTDRVESASADFDGTNTVTLDLDINPQNGEGGLRGTFELNLTNGQAAWKGELVGHFEQGMVVSQGVGRGTGSCEGRVIRIDFRQVK